MNRWKFYEENLKKFVSKDSSILIIGASKREFDLYKKLNYQNFTISNLNPNIEKENYEVIHVDATNIDFKNNSFDYVITHACIHHMRKPHLAILEMYRVSRIGTLIIEGNDSLLMRISGKLNMSEDFEVGSVDKIKNLGGVEESGIPNYVYRWNEREIYKTLSSYEPEIQHKILFSYENDLENPGIQRGIEKRTSIKVLKIFIKFFFTIFKKQQNLLSIYIDKKNSQKRKFKNF